MRWTWQDSKRSSGGSPANRSLFDEGDALTLNFSEQAIRRLKRHKQPFAGALKQVDVQEFRPRPDGP